MRALGHKTGTVGTLGANFVWENGAHYAIFNILGIAGEGLYEGPTTPDLEWPTWIVYSAVPLGSFLMCYRFLQVMVSFARTGELPTHDHGHVEGLDDDEDDALLVGEALAIGEHRVTYEGKSIEYRSVADLKAAIAEVQATLAREAGAPKSRQIRVTTSKAL